MGMVYDWEKNIIDVSDKYENHFHLELKGNKNVIKGGSGTGKTFLCNKIKSLKQSFNKELENSVDNIIVLNKDNVDQLVEYRGKLILIDNAELLLGDKEIEFINSDSNNNRYLLFARQPLGLELSPNHQADLIKDGNITKLKYRFNVKGWC